MDISKEVPAYPSSRILQHNIGIVKQKTNNNELLRRTRVGPSHHNLDCLLAWSRVAAM